MEWTHLACLLAGTFVGSFLMTVWRNERRYQRDERSRRAFEKAAHRGIIDLNLLYPPAPQFPITEGTCRGNVKCQCGGRPMPKGPPPSLSRGEVK